MGIVREAKDLLGIRLKSQAFMARGSGRFRAKMLTKMPKVLNILR